MSELIQNNDNRATIRWKLLTGVSALALTACVSTATAQAEDADRPIFWIELGGTLDQLNGLSKPFAPQFMQAITPTPAPYRGGAFDQSLPHYALGLDGKISFQPEGSNWVFSAGIRYGRSHRNRHVHHQTTVPPIHFTFYGYDYTAPVTYDLLADTHVHNREQHAIIDFAAGRDFGIGLFGGQGVSILDFGVRFAQFSSKSDVDAQARPEVGMSYPLPFPFPFPTFHEYQLHGQADRSFKGGGPSVSWSASTPIAGNPENGELTLDWGLDAALLFGRQKAKVTHTTKTNHLYHGNPKYGPFLRYQLTGQTGNTTNRSRNVTVPNIGGSIGLSVKYTNAKISIGYRYDTFLSAMDTGIDKGNKSDVTFNGPYASISIGLGD